MGSRFKSAIAALAGAGLLLAAPAFAEQKGKSREKPAAEKPLTPKKEDFDMAKVMAMFDKIFPPQPEPEPQRLALARSTAANMLPNGTYAGLFDELMGDTVERVLALSPADFGAKDAKGKAPAATTLRQEIAKNDPHFEERMRITRRVVSEELIKISAVIEPRLREGLARSMARRFDARQLSDINAFLATSSGKAFAGEAMKMWIDPDVMRSMMQSLPHMIGAVPGAMMRLESETAHLPKPKKPDKSKAADGKDDSPTT